MTLTTKLILIAALILSIIIPFGYYLIGERNRKKYKRAIGTNVFFFFGAFVITSIMMFAGHRYRPLMPQPLPLLCPPDSAISQLLWLPDFPVSVVVLPLQVQPPLL